MKRSSYLLSAVCLSLIMWSCGKSSKEGKSTFSQIKNSVKVIKSQSKNIQKLQSTMEGAQKLAEMDPIDQAELKAWLPKTLNNYKRTSYTTDNLNVMGTSGFKSQFTHQKDKNKTINFDVIDGAGSFAATVVSGFNQKLGLDTEEETEQYYKQTVEKQGYTAIEEQNNKSKNAKITFVHNERFLITLEGKNNKAADLWEFVNTLPLNRLK